MISNYIKISFRSIVRHKLYSALNILSLSIGLASVIMIFLWVFDEYSYDKQHVNKDFIYRITYDLGKESQNLLIGVSPAVVAKDINENMNEVEDVLRCRVWSGFIFKYKNIVDTENEVLLSDEAFFDFFSFKLLKGKKAALFSVPNYIILSQSLSQKYFGKENPIGKNINIYNYGDYKVTGVIEDITHSHLQFNSIISFNNFRQMGMEIDTFASYNYYSYLKVKQDINIDSLEQKINKLHEKYKDDLDTLDQLLPEVYLQKLEDIYLENDLAYNFINKSDYETIVIFAIIGIIILILACINFMNLTTARSINRIKEISIRKSQGASKREIIFQLFIEYFILTIIALIISLVLIEFFLPVINSLSDKNLSFTLLLDLPVLVLIAGFTLFAAIFSGSYPAFYLSGHRIIEFAKTNLKSNRHSGLFRKILVISQFSISVLLIIAALTIRSQFNYMTKLKLGYEKDHILYFFTQYLNEEEIKNISKDFISHESIHSVSRSSNLPVFEGSAALISKDSLKSDSSSFMLHFTLTGYNYIKTFGLDLIKGKDFHPEDSLIKKPVIINELAAEMLNLKDSVNNNLFFMNDTFTVIGIVKNFHYDHLKNKIKPFALILNPEHCRILLINAKDPNDEELQSFIEKKWQKYANEIPLTYRTLKYSVDKLYEPTKKLSRLVSYFSILAIMISCLGLFGLATFLIESRIKEIGVRKALGAHFFEVIILLSKDYLKWIFVSSLIAYPMAYFGLSYWLTEYAYHVKISPLIFILSTLLIMGVGIITVIWQSVKASLLNPSEALKDE